MSLISVRESWFSFVSTNTAHCKDGFASWNFGLIDRLVYESRPRDSRPRECQEFRRIVYSGHFEAGLDKRSGQGAGAAANIQDPMDLDRCVIEQSQNFGSRALRQSSEGSRLNVREILRVIPAISNSSDPSKWPGL
jgi:hypothetical protein